MVIDFRGLDFSDFLPEESGKLTNYCFVTENHMRVVNIVDGILFLEEGLHFKRKIEQAGTYILTLVGG